MNNQTSKDKTLFAVVAIALIIWGILGLMDAKNYSYSGYQSSGDYSIIKVEQGSPAEAAGMQVGDVIKTSGGIPITDSKALSARARTKIGEVREFVVNRNGEDVTLQLTFGALTEKDNSLNLVAFFIGLLFVVLGYYINAKLNTKLSLSFAVFALTFGTTFLSGPYIEPGFLSNLVSSVSTAVLMFSFASLAFFMLDFPPKSKFLEQDKNRKMLYVPAIIIIAIITLLNFLKPDSSSGMNTTLRLIFGVIIIFYFGLALITLIQKYLKTKAESRSATGLNHMVLGALIGLLPILIYFTINTISPKTILPGNDYIFLTFAAIPIFFVLGLLRSQKEQ